MWPQHPGQIRPLASDHHGLLIIPVHWLAASLSLLSTNKLVCGGRSGAIWLPSQKIIIKILFYKIRYNLISSVYLIDHIIWCKHNIHAVCIWIKTCTKILETSSRNWHEKRFVVYKCTHKFKSTIWLLKASVCMCETSCWGNLPRCVHPLEWRWKWVPREKRSVQVSHRVNRPPAHIHTLIPWHKHNVIHRNK